MTAETTMAVAAIALGIGKLRELALGDTADHDDQARVLKALYDGSDRDNSVLPQLADLLSDLGATLDDQGAGHTARNVGEAASFITDSAVRLNAARESLMNSEES